MKFEEYQQAEKAGGTIKEMLAEQTTYSKALSLQTLISNTTDEEENNDQ